MCQPDAFVRVTQANRYFQAEAVRAGAKRTSVSEEGTKTREIRNACSFWDKNIDIPRRQTAHLL